MTLRNALSGEKNALRANLAGATVKRCLPFSPLFRSGDGADGPARGLVLSARGNDPLLVRPCRAPLVALDKPGTFTMVPTQFTPQRVLANHSERPPKECNLCLSRCVLTGAHVRRERGRETKKSYS